MNRKGFTLIEIIVVIAIMGILVLMLIPNVFVYIEKNNEKSCNSLVNNIESAAKMYVINNKYNLKFTCSVRERTSTKEIELQTLIDSGDLKLDSSGKIINHVQKKEITLNDATDDVNVKIIYDCDTKIFTYIVNGISCTK